jgi:uncharacterized protein (DUF1800 family)
MEMGIRAVRLALFAALGLASMQAQTTPKVTIAPTAIGVYIGTYYRFTATVVGITPTTVAWSVALPDGAAGSPGTIDTGGLYTPPSTMPTGGTVIVKVASNVTPTVFDTATVSLLNPIPFVASVSPANIPLGPSTLTINGSGFVQGAVAKIGNLTMPTNFVSSTVLTVPVLATLDQMGNSYPLTVTSPNPGASTSINPVRVTYGSTDGPPVVTYSAAARFLDQAAWGPDAATIAHVQSVGFAKYLAEQFAAPPTPIPDPALTPYFNSGVQSRFFTNAVHGQDQLRQRVAFALLNILVVSGVQANNAPQFVPYLALMQKDAFANFRQTLEDVTLNPTMGTYLNMVNNDVANTATGTLPNENYAREILQLFSIGLNQLNVDGTLKLDANGNPIPTYTQTTIQQFAKLFTGWTYPTKQGATLSKHNPTNFDGVMVPFPANHDNTSKTLLNGFVVPAGQGPAADLKMALDNIFAHPNVGPFICKQLIQHLVMSNPSPAYVGRVASVFNNDGNGVRGNMAAVVTAILLDPEARAGDDSPAAAPANGGKLREPVFFLVSTMRALGAQVNDTNPFTGLATNLGQTIYYPPTVFNYFVPDYQIPQAFTGPATLIGPEFQLQSPSNAVLRYNTVNSIVYGNLGAGAVVNLTPFANLGNNMPALYQAIANAFFYGQLPPPLKNAMDLATSAITGTTAASMKARAQAALYLALSSGYYNVEH